MASPNLDLVRSIFSAWERGDYSSAEWAHPEIESVIADGPSPGSWKGLAGMAEGFRDVLSVWEEFHHEVDEYRELDGERVLVLSHFGGHGKRSGLEVGQMGARAAVLFHLHGGEVTRLVLYFDRERALAELGLGPESGSTRSSPRVSDPAPVDPQPEEVMRALADAWSGADRDAFLALMHPDAEMWLPRSALEGGAPYRGLDGAAQAWEDGFEIWQRFEAEPRGLSYVGDAWIAEYRVRCFPRGDGPRVEYAGHYVTDFRDGKVVYWRPYLDRAEALDAANARAARGVRPG